MFYDVVPSFSLFKATIFFEKTFNNLSFCQLNVVKKF